MFGWFSKRSRNSSTATTDVETNEPHAPVMREIPESAPLLQAHAAPAWPAPPAPPAPSAPPARPEVPPGSSEPSRELLVTRLRNVDPDIRVAAARELGRRDDATVVPALIATLQDAHAPVRIAGCHALGKLRDERAVEPLAGALSNDPDGNVQAAARGALGAIGTPAADAALAADDARRARAEAEAQARANPSIDRSRGIAGLIDAFRGPHVRLHDDAADGLAEAGPAAVESLAGLLADEHVGTRKRAADLLGRIGDAQAAEPLRNALERISRDDRSIETYQFRQSVQRALDAVTVTTATTTRPPPRTPEPEAALPVSRIEDVSGASTEVSATERSAPEPSSLAKAQAAAVEEAPARPQTPAAPLDPALAQLTDEQLGERLVEIARAAIGGGRPPLDDYDVRRNAARAIGEAFHARGGLDAMRRAFDTYLSDLLGRHAIDQAWDGVGEWMG